MEFVFRLSNYDASDLKQETARLLQQRKVRGEVRFDDSGAALMTGETQELADYQELTGVFETERLWLVVDEKSMALLLQKKDLVSGEADAFLPYLQGKIIK